MGIALALASALGFSFSNILIRQGIRPGDKDNGVLTTVIVNLMVFTPALLIVGLVENLPPWDTTAIMWFAAAGFCTTYLGRNSLYAAIRHLGAARASAVKNTSPLVTVLLGVTLLGENLSLRMVGGIGLILLALFLLTIEAFRLAGRPTQDVPQALSITLSTDAPLSPRATGTSAPIGELASPRGGTQVGGHAPWIGSVFAGLAALSFASGQVFSKAGMELTPSAVLGAAIGSWTAFLIYLASAALHAGAWPLLRDTVRGARRSFWLAGLAGSVGSLSFFAALNFAPVSLVAVVVASETVFTVALAALVIRHSETVSRSLVVPVILVLAGTIILAL